MFWHLFNGRVPFIPTVNGIISLVSIFHWVFDLLDSIMSEGNFFHVDNSLVVGWGNNGWWVSNFVNEVRHEIFRRLHVRTSLIVES